MRQNGQKNLLPKHRSQPSCSYYNTIYDSQMLTIKVFRAQLQQRGTLTQPFHCDLLTLSCKFKQNDAPRLQKWQLQNLISTPKRKKHDLEALFKRILLKENHLRQNLLLRHRSQPSCSDCYTIYDSQVLNTMVSRTQPQQQETLLQPFRCDLRKLNGTTQ